MFMQPQLMGIPKLSCQDVPWKAYPPRERGLSKVHLVIRNPPDWQIDFRYPYAWMDIFQECEIHGWEFLLKEPYETTAH